MLAHHRTPVCLSFISTDLPILSTIETTAFLYQKDSERFHLLLTQQNLPQSVARAENSDCLTATKGLLWLEISPYRVTLTMQGKGKFSYRHFWEEGIYGVSRYWLNNDASETMGSLRLRNFTRSLKLEGNPLPKSLRIDYELWSAKVCLGHYILHLEIHH